MLVFLDKKLELNQERIVAGDIVGAYFMNTPDNTPIGPPNLVRFTVQNNNILLPRGTVFSNDVKS